MGTELSVTDTTSLYLNSLQAKEGHSSCSDDDEGQQIGFVCQRFADAYVEEEYVRHLQELYRIRAPIVSILLLTLSVILFCLHVSVLWRSSSIALKSILIVVTALSALQSSLYTYVGRRCAHSEVFAHWLLTPVFLYWIVWFILFLRFLADLPLTVSDLTGTSICMASIVLIYGLITDFILPTRTRLSLASHLIMILLCFVYTCFTQSQPEGLGLVTDIIEWSQAFYLSTIIVCSFMLRARVERIERTGFPRCGKECQQVQSGRRRLSAVPERIICQTRFEETLQTLEKVRLTLSTLRISEKGEISVEVVDLLNTCYDLLCQWNSVEGSNYDAYPTTVGEEVDCLKAFETGISELDSIKTSNGQSILRQVNDVVDRPTGQDYSITSSENAKPFWNLDSFPKITLTQTTLDQLGRSISVPFNQLAQSHAHLLYQVGCRLLLGFCDLLGITDETMRKYLIQLTVKYHPNPYHNGTHAAMVANSFEVLLSCFQLNQEIDRLSHFGYLVACFAHDVGHPGRTQPFGGANDSLVSLAYGEDQILERYHAFLCFRLATIGSEQNIFQFLHRANFFKLRREMISAILMTDMASHFSFLSKFRLRKKDIELPLDSQMMMQALVKTADISHVLSTWDEHRLWALAIHAEFSAQAAIIGHLGYHTPVSSQTKTSFVHSQTGFVDHVVLPLVQELAILGSPSFHRDLVDAAMRNRQSWIDAYTESYEHSEETPIYAIAEVGLMDRLFLQAITAKNIRELNAPIH